jgi:exonuclease III
VPDAINSKPTSRVLNILKGVGASDGAPTLTTVMSSVAQTERYTNWFDKNSDGVDQGTAGLEHSAIDHVLASPGVAGKITGVTYDHSVPASARVSDHWPIIVTLQG